MSPVTLFTGLPAHDPFTVILDKNSGQIRNLRISSEDLLKLHEDLASLQDIHKKVEIVKANL
jgi:hypothetical protein